MYTEQNSVYISSYQHIYDLRRRKRKINNDRTIGSNMTGHEKFKVWQGVLHLLILNIFNNRNKASIYDCAIVSSQIMPMKNVSWARSYMRVRACIAVICISHGCTRLHFVSLVNGQKAAGLILDYITSIYHIQNKIRGGMKSRENNVAVSRVLQERSLHMM